jgi:hypothetical protein
VSAPNHGRDHYPGRALDCRRELNHSLRLPIGLSAFSVELAAEQRRGAVHTHGVADVLGEGDEPAGVQLVEEYLDDESSPTAATRSDPSTGSPSGAVDELGDNPTARLGEVGPGSFEECDQPTVSDLQAADRGGLAYFDAPSRSA